MLLAYVSHVEVDVCHYWCGNCV